MHRLMGSLGVLLCTATLAASATVHVATTGSDGAGCGSPLRTIGAGVRCLQPGDTLLIHGGTYQESLTDGTFPSDVTVQAAPGETVIWQAVHGCSWPQDCRMPVYLKYAREHHITFDGLIFDGADRRLGTAAVAGDIRAGIDAGPHHITFRNCEFRNADGEITVGSASDITFEGGSVHDSGDPSGLRHGFYTNHVRNLTIRDMGICNVTGYGLHHWTNDASAPSTNLTVTGNRIVSNGSAAGQCGLILDGIQGGRIAGNTVVRNGSNSEGCGMRVGYTVPANGLAIVDNTITDHPGAGVDLFNGTGHQVSGNRFARNGVNVNNRTGAQMQDNTMDAPGASADAGVCVGSVSPARRPTPTPHRLRVVKTGR